LRFEIHKKTTYNLNFYNKI